MSLREFAAFAESKSLLPEAAGWHDYLADVDVGGAFHKADVTSVTATFFQMIGVSVEFGRSLTAADFDSEGVRGNQVAVITDEAWRTRFASATNIIGRTLGLGRQTYEIVGVLRPPFTGLRLGVLTEAFVPFQTASTPETSPSLWVLGRLSPAVPQNTVVPELTNRWKRIAHETRPEWLARQGDESANALSILPASTGFALLRTQYERPLKSVSALAWLVLAIAYTNALSLFCARAAQRSKEIALRDALGQPTYSKICETLEEPMMIATVAHLIGGALAILLARPVILSLWTGAFPPTLGSGLLETPTLQIACVTCSAIVVMSLPQMIVALTSRLHMSSQGTNTLGSSRMAKRLLSCLLVVQVAASFGAGATAIAITRAVRGTLQMPLGFDPKQVETYWLTRNPLSHPSKDNCQCTGILSSVANQPGVEAASFANVWPTLGAADEVHVAAMSSNDSKYVIAEQNYVSPRFFGTMGIPILWGSDFVRYSLEKPHNEGVEPVIVSASLAQRLTGGQNAVGKLITLEKSGDGDGLLIVGVVGDANISHPYYGQRSLIYRSILQQPGQWMMPVLHVRLTGSGDRLSRDALRRIIDSSTVFYVWRQISLTDQVDSTVYQRVLVMRLAILCGCACVVLSLIGLYGAVTYIEIEERKANALRLALGATLWSLMLAKLLRLIPWLFGGLFLGVVPFWWVGKYLDWSNAARFTQVSAGLQMAALLVTAMLGLMMLALARGCTTAIGKMLREE